MIGHLARNILDIDHPSGCDIAHYLTPPLPLCAVLCTCVHVNAFVAVSEGARMCFHAVGLFHYVIVPFAVFPCVALASMQKELDEGHVRFRSTAPQRENLARASDQQYFVKEVSRSQGTHAHTRLSSVPLVCQLPTTPLS